MPPRRSSPSPHRFPLDRFSSAERQAISAKAGKAAQATGRAHRWTPEAAKAAAKKGWATMQAKKRQRQEAAARANAQTTSSPDPAPRPVEKAVMP